MTISDKNTVDIVLISDDRKRVTLGITDHLRWGNDKDLPNQEHLELLQHKLNCCAEFIDSGQMHEMYPRAKGAQEIIFKVFCLYTVEEPGCSFYEKARDIFSEMDVKIEVEYKGDDPDFEELKNS